MSESAGLHVQSHWVWCTTNLTAYAGFTGDLAAAILRTDGTMTAAGWHDTRGSAGAAVHTLRNGLGIPEVGYSTGEPTTCGQVSWTMTQRWLAAGQRPPPGAEPLPPADTRALHWDVHPLDHDAVRADLLSRHQYVVVVSLGLTCTYPVDD